MQANSALLLATGLALSALAAPASADAISEWSAKANAIATEQREQPRTRARTLAIVAAAIWEAVRAAEPEDTTGKPNVSAERSVSIEAAAAAAAHDALVALYPERAPDLSPALAASLAGIANDVRKARGFALGKKSAAEVLTWWLPTPPGKKDMGPQIGSLAGETRP